MNKNPITKELYNNWIELAKQAGSLEEEITNRMTFVINRTCEMFGAQLSTWYFDDAQEGEVGDLFRALKYGGEFTPVLDWKKKPADDMKLILKDGTETDITFDGFPIRWLFEDFEPEIKEGKFKYKEKEIRRKTEMKNLSEKQKAEQIALIESAKSKLSKKELAALKKAL